MRIVLLCATNRGYLFLKRLMELGPENNLVVFSFREEPWEPPFLERIQDLTETSGGGFFEARQVGNDSLASFWDSTPIDLMFAVNWRYMVPSRLYRRAKLGAFVFHDSLLPRYRGFSPTVWAMINGEGHTGVSLFEFAEPFDSGDIVDQQPVPIEPDDTAGIVMDRVTEAYLQLLNRNWQGLITGTAPRKTQDQSKATYTCKRLPEDNQIDWSVSTDTIYNLIRAVSSPYPGAFTFLNGRKILVWSAQRLSNPLTYAGRVPGRVVEIRKGEGTVVLTGDGLLLLKTVQVEGEDETCASDILKSIGQTLSNKK